MLFYKKMRLRPRLPEQMRQEPAKETKQARRVLNSEHHDPAKQISVREVVVRVIALAQVLLERQFYPYQVKLAYRIVESVLLRDGEVITALFARQSGKTEVVGGICAALAIVLPQLAKAFPDDWHLNITDDTGHYRGFATGLEIGIYAPKQEQSEITFNRVKRATETRTGKKVIREAGLSATENNGDTLAFTNGSRVICRSASQQAIIEGATHHLLIIEEAQVVSDLVVRKSLHPMAASTNGTIVKVGTANTFKCDFYSAIQTNRRRELITGKVNHFFFPWSVCVRYNSLYRAYIEKEKVRIGEGSDEFRMAYGGEWIFERGMFITQDVLFNHKVAQQVGPWSESIWSTLGKRPELARMNLVLGIDWGASSDSTVVCLMLTDWANPTESGSTSDASGTYDYVLYQKHVIGWWEFLGDNYEYQFNEIVNRCAMLPNLHKIIMDSNACGKPIYDRFAAYFGPKHVEVTPFNFNAKLKSDGFKSLSSDLWGERLTFPAGPKEMLSQSFRKFVQQMLDLKKEWKNGIMHVAHPNERGAHDDFADAIMLAAWGCNSPAISTKVHFADENPFYN